MCDAVNEGKESREAGDKQPERNRICGTSNIHSFVFLSPQSCRRRKTPPAPSPPLSAYRIYSNKRCIYREKFISAAAPMQSKATNFQIKAAL